MSDQFSVGEVAIYITISKGQQECVIREGPGLLTHMDLLGHIDYKLGYYIEVPEDPSDGRLGWYFAFPYQLRKRRPPQDWNQLCKLDCEPTPVAEVLE